MTSWSIIAMTTYLPAIAGILVFKKINTSFYPFIFYVWVGCINETVSTLISNAGGTTILNSNIYIIIASFLLVWFFKKQGTIKSRKLYLGILASLLVVWVLEHFVFSRITNLTAWFRMYWSFLTVLLSINTLNIVLLKRVNLLRDSLFLISISLIIFYSYKSIVETFGTYGLEASMDFNRTIYSILAYLNGFTNLVYLPAILWIPKKKPSLLQFSSPALSSG